MSKLFSIIIILIFIEISVFAADTKKQPILQKTAISEKSDHFKKQMKNLENQRRMLSMKIYQLRIKLISTDSDMLSIHNQIMKLHKQLAVELNNNDEMKSLLDQAQDIDDKIKNLIETENDNK